MNNLNLPLYSFRFRELNGISEIYDSSRRKFVKLTPEEWVRQNFLMYLINEKSFPASLISVEKTLKYNKLSKKADIVIYDNTARARIIVECKAPSVSLSQETFDQIARYNFPLRADYLIITNGMEHYCCKMDYTNNAWQFVKEIPNYDTFKI